MRKLIRNKLIICSLVNVFSAEEMVAITVALINDPQLALEDIILRKGIWQNYNTACKKLDAVKKALEIENINRKMEKLQRTGTKVCTIIDEDYPDELKEIYLPPVVIYFQGDWELTRGKRLGIVGSRQITEYGKNVIATITPEVVRAGIITVSGLAKGVDREVHKQTIKHNGATIAVIGTGMDQFYPAENKELQKVMLKTQLVLSEYPLSVGPQRHHFPMRNRIIAGLSQGVLVVEAKEKSGSLITANVALQENREVFAVPGNILNAAYKGTNQLIQAGAKAVLSFEDIVSEMIGFWQKK
ncbi:DNA-processing protein DprA [Jeotgalibaca sp. A122]|uniref:DNA-processing protein DprA n=1 Tax=Jeotgalibaca sp. A122 TaxID=3457322 RepID=UPI003FD675E1